MTFMSCVIGRETCQTYKWDTQCYVLGYNLNLIKKKRRRYMRKDI